MSKGRDLGWAWKPDEQTLLSAKTNCWHKSIRRKQKKKKRTLTKREKLFRAPGHIFYRSKSWQFLRWRVLASYGRKCMSCGLVDTEIHVDHIKPRSKFPHLSLTFDNLQVLCRDCNMEKSNIHSEDYREKAIGEELDRATYLKARSIL